MFRTKALKHACFLCFVQTDAEKDCGVVFLQRFDGEVRTQRLVVVELHAQVLTEPNLPTNTVVVTTKLRDLVRRQAPSHFRLFKYVDVAIPKTTQIVGTTDSGRASTNYGNWLVKRRSSPSIRIPCLWDPQLHELRARELLEAANIDRPFFSGGHVAGPNTQLRGGANHATAQSHGVIVKDGFGGTVIVFGCNALNEHLDVDGCGARPSAGSIGTLKTPR
mmetsp:Transcript_703/g.1562  ORF Transcript_703/g.1562 Transcript_703/m.1562 type:complete len:220 (+) Transcript_703:1191-1850(+)